MMEQHRLYSCDDHLDIHAMPADAWTSRLPAKLREQGPLQIEHEGRTWWQCAGKLVGVSGLHGASGALGRVPGLDPDGLRSSNPRFRLEDMDRDGVWASIVYGPNTLFGYKTPDPVHKQAAIRAWNEWAAEEFNSVAPDRLRALPTLPSTSPQAAVDELQHALGRGHIGAVFPCFEVDLLDRQWDRLWSACEEAGVPLSFHIGGGTSVNPAGVRGRATFAAIAPLQLDEALAKMIYGGALERHPRLKLVLAESGVGWLPYFVARLDSVFHMHCAPYPDDSISLLPSELVRRQVYGTFEEDPLGPQLMPLLPEGTFMWACDYPHPDSTWPHSGKAIAEALSTLSESARRKVTGETCRELYGLP
jgi:predicted TIM-barrel fold metal-dependent hydrolase